MLHSLSTFPLEHLLHSFYFNSHSISAGSWVVCISFVIFLPGQAQPWKLHCFCIAIPVTSQPSPIQILYLKINSLNFQSPFKPTPDQVTNIQETSPFQTNEEPHNSFFLMLLRWTQRCGSWGASSRGCIWPLLEEKLINPSLYVLRSSMVLV